MWCRPNRERFGCYLAPVQAEPRWSSFATFKREARFDGSRFPKSADFGTAHARADFRIASASFGDGSSFQDLHVDEVLLASGASFGEINFGRIEVGKSTFFRTGVKGKRVDTRRCFG